MIGADGMRNITTILQSCSVNRVTLSVYPNACDSTLVAVSTLKYALQIVIQVVIGASLLLKRRIVTRLINVTNSMTIVAASAMSYLPRKDQNHPKASEERIMR